MLPLMGLSTDYACRKNFDSGHGGESLINKMENMHGHPDGFKRKVHYPRPVPFSSAHTFQIL